jgi:16S rRNA processing protein RimM
MIAGFIEIGKIVGAQGLTGEVRVYPSSDFPERFLEPGKRWLLAPGAAEPKSVELVKGRYLEGKGLYVVQMVGITDRDQAEALRNSVFLVSDRDRLPLEEGEFHILDLIGLEVFDQPSQTLIGTVINVISAGNDLLEVQRSPGQTGAEAPSPKTVLIPFVKAIVPVVDLSHRRIEITPPTGLIEQEQKN